MENHYIFYSGSSGAANSTYAAYMISDEGDKLELAEAVYSDYDWYYCVSEDQLYSNDPSQLITLEQADQLGYHPFSADMFEADDIPERTVPLQVKLGTYSLYHDKEGSDVYGSYDYLTLTEEKGYWGIS